MWSIVCRNSWMTVSPKVNLGQRTHKHRKLWPFSSTAVFLWHQIKGKCCWCLKKALTLCIAGFSRSDCVCLSFPEDFAYMLVTPQHQGETCRAISYQKGNHCCCSTKAAACLWVSPPELNTFILPVIVTGVICFQETPLIILTFSETPMM